MRSGSRKWSVAGPSPLAEETLYEEQEFDAEFEDAIRGVDELRFESSNKPGALKRVEKALNQFTGKTAHDRLRKMLAPSASLPFLTTNPSVERLKAPTITMPRERRVNKKYKSKSGSESAAPKHETDAGEDYLTRKNVEELRRMVEKASACEGAQDTESGRDFSNVLRTWKPALNRGIELVESRSFGLGMLFRSKANIDAESMGSSVSNRSKSTRTSN
jgi:hypothetical protein